MANRDENLNWILSVGINHRTAPIQVRERYALSRDETSRVYETLYDRESVPELFVLSTCNRTEIYGVSDRPKEFARWVSAMFRELGKPATDPLKRPFNMIQGDMAILHLLRVTAGMDSMMLGETQIAAQVKEALSQARKAGATGPILNRLVQMSLEAGKRVRTETSLSGGAMSVSYAAVELASEMFPDLSRTSVLLVGAGNVGRLTASYFRKKGVTRFFVSNRHTGRGKALADGLGGTFVPLDNMASVLFDMNIVVTCTAARTPQLTLEALRKNGKVREADLLVLDLSVPRNVEVAAYDLSGITLFAVDDLETVVADNIATRGRELPQAERIIGEVKDKFFAWIKTLTVAPTIRELTETLNGVKRKEMERVRNAYPREVADEVERISERLIRTLLKNPISTLKASAESGDDASRLVDTVRALFDLKASADDE